MPSFSRPIAIAALMGATMLAYPLNAARADSTTSAPAQMGQTAEPQHQAATQPASTRAAGVEQRITSLHKQLKITREEEPKWDAVAQAMRDNAAAMEKLRADNAGAAPQSMTALQDLENYQKVAEAHVDHLKSLIPAFESLYDAMPDAQKKVADQVFQSFGRNGARSRG